MVSDFEVDKILVEQKRNEELEENLENRLLEYSKKLTSLVRVRDVDREELSDLIIRAKGPRRSIRQFAMELGVNPSTLTRIINLQTSKPSKDELILKIAQNADPDSGVTEEKLLEAQGVEKRNENNYEEYIVKSEHRIRQILLEEFFNRGYMFSASNEKKEMYDMVIEIDEGKSKKKWAFDFKVVMDGRLPVGMGITRRWIDRVMASFYRGDAGVDKITLVVEQKLIYEQIKNMLSRYTIPDEISIMLINSNGILDEFTVHRC